MRIIAGTATWSYPHRITLQGNGWGIGIGWATVPITPVAGHEAWDLTNAELSPGSTLRIKGASDYETVARYHIWWLGRVRFGITWRHATTHAHARAECGDN